MATEQASSGTNGGSANGGRANGGRATGGRWRVIAGLAVILVLSGGWFLLSSTVMHTAVVDALGEAAGVAFALLVVVSAVGAVLNSRHGDTPEEPGD